MENTLSKPQDQGNEANTILVAGYKFQKFPNRKPRDYGRVRVLLNDNSIETGVRLDTGFGREWHLDNAKRRVVWDKDVKGWWYI